MENCARANAKHDADERRVHLVQRRELIVVSDMNIGKWYDPISQRWIVPREESPIATFSQASTEKRLDTRKSREAQRIWDLLVDCCARG
ncbi:hypothetical protein [Bradyrhizobium centrolobii]|uniref:hypothetical protein n=1 Tax=Bradyrhizobium centrolobii TaxID=1505087 RepID=UPI0009ECC7A3|nr:hypothetical protein [Bradyrhizobium centrolobii]